MPLAEPSPSLDPRDMDAIRPSHPSQTALAATLRPRSIAVVGASPRSFAGQIVQHNCADHRFEGLVVPVNGKYADVAGVPTVASLSDLATAPDAVVALVGTARVQAIAEEAAAIGAGAVIVPGGGFTDSGGAASDLGASLATLSDVTGISVVGPNCMGVVDFVTGAMPYIGTVPLHRVGRRVEPCRGRAWRR